eukprot:751524-Hanusia_phi.AAC.4
MNSDVRRVRVSTQTSKVGPTASEEKRREEEQDKDVKQDKDRDRQADRDKGDKQGKRVKEEEQQNYRKSVSPSTPEGSRPRSREGGGGGKRKRPDEPESKEKKRRREEGGKEGRSKSKSPDKNGDGKGAGSQPREEKGRVITFPSLRSSVPFAPLFPLPFLPLTLNAASLISGSHRQNLRLTPSDLVDTRKSLVHDKSKLNFFYCPPPLLFIIPPTLPSSPLLLASRSLASASSLVSPPSHLALPTVPDISSDPQQQQTRTLTRTSACRGTPWLSSPPPPRSPRWHAG